MVWYLLGFGIVVTMMILQQLKIFRAKKKNRNQYQIPYSHFHKWNLIFFDIYESNVRMQKAFYCFVTQKKLVMHFLTLQQKNKWFFDPETRMNYEFLSFKHIAFR